MSNGASDTALWAVVVAAVAVVVNASVSIFLHLRRAAFDKGLAEKKFDYDVELATKKFDYDAALAERKATLDYLSANYQRKQRIAGEILTAFYEVQRMMPAIRSPGSWEGEGASRPRMEGEAVELAKTRDGYYVTLARIDKNRATLARFLSMQFNAMAELGLDAGKPFEDFNQLLSRISTSASMLIRTAGAERPPPQTEKWHADIWEGYGDAEDKVQIEFDRIAKAIEAICRPSLSAKAPSLAGVSSS
jgi:hypothetical protein